jgi:YD repeat-containing protein
VISLIDSSQDVQSESNYQYDAAGRLSSIKNITKDPTMQFNETELHLWIYNSKGQPEKVWRILNGKDSLEIRFTIDDSNNVSDEQIYKRGVGVDPVYYYYDDINRLTDIVRFNKKMNRLLPDFMFEYDENDRVIQKITTLSSFNMGYLIWRYIYDAKGLKTKEALFNKDKELTGKIDYSYTFSR